MKYIKHLEFIFSASLLIVLITLTLTYLLAAILAHSGLSSAKLFTTYFLQAVILIFSSNWILKKLSHEYFTTLNKGGIIKLKKIVFGIFFSLVLIVLLITLDYVISWIIDFGLSYKYGSYMDKLLSPEDGSLVSEKESFTHIPITLQNIVFNIFAFIIIIFVSKAKYKVSE